MAETPRLLGIYIFPPEGPFLAVSDILGCQVSPAIKMKR